MTEPMFDLSGKTTLITGGSRGLGRAMANAFAAHGADVIIASRKSDACETTAGEIAANHGVRTLPSPATWAIGTTAMRSSSAPMQSSVASTSS